MTIASSVPLPRYPSTPEIEELDASVLEDDDDGCARTLERRVVDHPCPSVAPTAIDLFSPTPHESTFSPKARLPSSTRLLFIAGAVGTCALLLLCCVLVGGSGSSPAASPRGETRIERHGGAAAATNRIATSHPAPLLSTATATATPTPSLTPLDLPIATDPSPIHTPPATTSHARKRAVATGTIRTFHYPMKRLVLVDGRGSGYAGSPIQVSCGRHRVQIGTDPAKDIVVPCSGAITVGSPER